MGKTLLTIGKLAAISAVNVETIRFYERKGILQQPRKLGAFRYYSKDYVDRIYFVKRSQELGFTLKEAKDLLDLKIRNQAKCSDVLLKTEEKIIEINEKINDLKKMKKSLKALANCCDDASVPLRDCPVLDCFTDRK